MRRASPPSVGRALPVGLVAVGVLAGSAVGLAPSSAADADVVIRPNPVSLRMATSEGMSEAAVTSVLDTLFEAPARPRYPISRIGSGLARSRLAGSLADGTFSATEERVAISGTPFTTAELASIPAAKRTLARLPVHAVAPALITTGPAIGPDGFGTERFTEDGLIEPGPPEPLDGPNAAVGASTFRLPWKNLAAMYLEVSQGNANWWLEPGLLAEWGFELEPTTGTFRRPASEFYLVGVDGYPKFSAFFEPSDVNYWVQEALRRSQPAVWEQYFQLTGEAVPATSSESYVGGFGTVWRSKGIGELLRHLADPAGSLRGFADQTIRGSMTASPLWTLDQLSAAYPASQAKRWVAEVRNGAGEWVLPTSAAVTAAIAAGGEEPLHALENATPGAYPLAWVESLYAPTTGLTIDETNALAALVRLLVTDGQDIVREDGDGVISAGIRDRSLATMNATVTSNCEAAGGVVLTTAESPYLPPADLAPKLRALPAQAWCGTKVPAATTTTTTTLAPTTTTTLAPTTVATTTPPTTARAASVQGGGTTPRTTPRTAATTPAPVATTAAPPTTEAVTSTTAASTTTPATTTAAAPPLPPEGSTGDTLPVRVVLPFGVPEAQAGGFNRLMTMVLGGLSVLWLRRSLTRRRRLA